MSDILAGEWIEWSGGKCPVDRGTLVDVKTRDGAYGTFLFAGSDLYLPESEGGAIAEDWSHDGSGGDIVSYRLVSA